MDLNENRIAKRADVLRALIKNTQRADFADLILSRSWLWTVDLEPESGSDEEGEWEGGGQEGGGWRK